MITSWNGDLMGCLMGVLTWIFGGYIYIYIHIIGTYHRYEMEKSNDKPWDLPSLFLEGLI